MSFIEVPRGSIVQGLGFGSSRRRSGTGVWILAKPVRTRTVRSLQNGGVLRVHDYTLNPKPDLKRVSGFRV